MHAQLWSSVARLLYICNVWVSRISRHLYRGTIRNVFESIIQGATRIPTIGIGLAVGYGSYICHRCVIILVYCGLLGLVCSVPAD